MPTTNPEYMNPDFFSHENEFIYLQFDYKKMNKQTQFCNFVNQFYIQDWFLIFLMCAELSLRQFDKNY